MGTKIGIIGTAGKSGDSSSLNRLLYNKMFRHLVKLLDEIAPSIKDRILVSGGAAWSDHLAVSIFLSKKSPSLILFFPCKFDEDKCLFVAQKGHLKPEHASIANYYHHQFGEEMNGDKYSSLKGIKGVLQRGAQGYPSYKGFLSRNLAVGKVDILIAFTFKQGDCPPPHSGTGHTWNHSKASTKIHIPINSL